MSFVQPPPQLGNQYRGDRVLRSYLRRVLAPATLAAIESDLDVVGAYAASAWRQARSHPAQEPTLTQWDAWGNRIDRLELTPAWKVAQEIAARFGLVAAGHESTHGAAARTHQFALVYLFHCASEFFSCPLAMSDGATMAIKASGNAALIAHALPHLLSRDPDQHWIAGQWMTETSGGSDVSASETTARFENGQWRLHGRKWFTSAINSQMALALARPENAAAGSEGLALFYIEPRDAEGRWQNLSLDRLKHKLGTRELPTAEIHLEGTPAQLVGDPHHGVRAIAPMLNVTRTWNAVCAIATMRRALALAHDYAQKRQAFGRALIDQPLHRATLDSLQAQFAAALHLTFYVAELLGLAQTGAASPAQQNLLRLLTPLAKLWTGKLALAIASEACECFGGAGYLEDSGLPQLLRDAQVFSIWEGTTNVLALDFLRALRSAGGVATLLEAQAGLHAEIQSGALAKLAKPAAERIQVIAAALQTLASERAELEANARAIALGLVENFALSLLLRHADWAQRIEGDDDPAKFAARFSDLLPARKIRGVETL
jgi:acyl-CoA dehydrogenase